MGSLLELDTKVNMLILKTLPSDLICDGYMVCLG